MPILEFGIPVFIMLFVFYGEFDFGSVQIYTPAPFVVTIKFSILFGRPQLGIPLRWFGLRIKSVDLCFLFSFGFLGRHFLTLCFLRLCLFLFFFFGCIFKVKLCRLLVKYTGDGSYCVSQFSQFIRPLLGRSLNIFNASDFIPFF